MTEPATPLMQQYHSIKARYPHALLLFRLGDFYELFYEDAMIASRELQITLTSRNREKGQPIPMCGVPYHAAEGYLARLIRAGFKIAICDQMEQPGPGKQLVRLEVWTFQRDYGERILREQFGVAELTGFGLDDHPQALSAAGAIIHYLRENAARGDRSGEARENIDAPSVEALGHLDRVRYYEHHDTLVLDPVSVRNLEFLNPIFSAETGRSSGPATLIAALDVTVTGMGARLLRTWLLRPLLDRDAIEARLAAV